MPCGRCRIELFLAFGLFDQRRAQRLSYPKISTAISEKVKTFKALSTQKRTAARTLREVTSRTAPFACKALIAGLKAKVIFLSIATNFSFQCSSSSHWITWIKQTCKEKMWFIRARYILLKAKNIGNQLFETFELCNSSVFSDDTIQIYVVLV